MKSTSRILLAGIIIAACGCMFEQKKADTPVKEAGGHSVESRSTGDAAGSQEPDAGASEMEALMNKEIQEQASSSATPAAADAGTAASGTPEKSVDPEKVFKELSQQEQIKKQLAGEQFADANSLFEQSKFKEAAALYEKALSNDPTLAEARRKLNECQALMNDRKGTAEVYMEDTIALESARHQARLHEIDRTVENAIAEMTALRFKQAENLLQRAQAQLALLPVALETRQRRQRIEQLLIDAREGLRQSRIKTKKEQERQIQAAIKRDQKFREQLTEEKIKILLERAYQAYQLQDYEQCIQIAEAILDERPRQQEALTFLKNAQRLQRLEWDKYLAEEDKEETLKTMESVEKSAIPYAVPFTFPGRDKWVNIVQQRSGEITIGEEEESLEVKQIKHILQTTKINLDFDNKPLIDVIDFIKQVAQINIHIDRDVDEQETKVSLNLTGIKLVDALEHIMTNTGLAYTFDKNVLKITIPSKAKGRLVFKIYNVTDIISKIRDFPGPELQITTPDEADAMSGGSSGMGGTGGFGFVEADETTTLNVEDLKQLIEESTGPSEWSMDSQIEPHRGQLLVTATPEMHQKVKKVLRELRKDSDLFVVVRARFVDITDDFLEDIGIDYRNLGQENTLWNDLYDGRIHNSRTGGQDVGFTNGINVQDPELVGRMQHMFDGFSSLIQGDRVSGGPGGLGGLTAQFMIVDPYQVNAILRAVQEESGVRSVIAPEVTAHNGQQVFVSVITQRSYIADYELVSGGTTWTLTEVADPIVDINEEGVVLDVRPTVNADRKYITIDVKPTLANLIGGVISTVLINLGTVSAAAMQVPIGLPKMSIQRTWTSVIVPDGGTVLLGGFRSMERKKYISTVPIIGKIPILNLFVSRKAELEEKRSLVILLTAKLIDLRREEAEKFGK